MRPITEIIVHCAATNPDWMEHHRTSEKVKEIRRWHVVDNGWSDIGYHAVIDRDGTIQQGRADTRTGAHVQGHNTGTLGVCLIGGHGGASTDSFADHFTIDQADALRSYIASKRVAYPTIAKISGHNEYANKGCPSFTVGVWLDSGSYAKPQPANPFLTWLIRFLGGYANA